jgi:outer membrane protein assembly factor BamB
MVPELTRRRLLVAGGLTATALTGGYALADSIDSPQDSPNGWPMARHGPAGRGFSASARPPTDGVTVAWRQPFDGRIGYGYGDSPVVADGRVVALADELLVVDAAGGEVQFRANRRSTAAPAVAPARAYESPTLATSGQRGVTGLHADGGVDLFGSERGLTRWHRDGSETDDATTIFSSSPNTSPLVAVGDTLLVPAGGSLTAVDASDGSVAWQREAGDTRPVVRDGVVYTTRFPDGIVGFDLTTGERQTQFRPGEETVWSVTATPDGLVASTREGLVGCSTDGTVRWRFQPQDLTDSRAAVAVGDGTAYAGLQIGETNTLVAVDTTDGSERWRNDIFPASAPQFAPPAVAERTVYVPTQTEGLLALDATDGRVRWRFESESEQAVPMAPPALAGDRLYTTDAEYVYALEEP